MLRGVGFAYCAGAIVIKMGIASTYRNLALPGFRTNAVTPIGDCSGAINASAVVGIIGSACISIEPFSDDTRIFAGCTTADILRLPCLNHAIQQNFEFYAAIGAVALRSAKTRGLDRGILPVCAVVAIFTILSIRAIYAIADISCLGSLNHTIQQNFYLGAAIGTSAL